MLVIQYVLCHGKHSRVPVIANIILFFNSCLYTKTFVSILYKPYHTGRGSVTARLLTVQLDRDSIGSGLLVDARIYLYCKGLLRSGPFIIKMLLLKFLYHII